MSCLSLMKCCFRSEYERGFEFIELFKLVELLDLNVVQSLLENNI